MNNNQFKEFCAKELKKRGFEKIKNCFYFVGQDLLCGIYLQRSNYAKSYYVNYFYCIGNYNGATELPTYHDNDIEGRVCAMSKTQTYQGKHYMTPMIEYEEYTEDELRPFFDKEFKEKILPPLCQGKKYILDNLNRLYFLTLNQNEVINKLKE